MPHSQLPHRHDGQDRKGQEDSSRNQENIRNAWTCLGQYGLFSISLAELTDQLTDNRLYRGRDIEMGGQREGERRGMDEKEREREREKEERGDNRERGEREREREREKRESNDAATCPSKTLPEVEHILKSLARLLRALCALGALYDFALQSEASAAAAAAAAASSKSEVASSTAVSSCSNSSSSSCCSSSSSSTTTTTTTTTITTTTTTTSTSTTPNTGCPTTASDCLTDGLPGSLCCPTTGCPTTAFDWLENEHENACFSEDVREYAEAVRSLQTSQYVCVSSAEASIRMFAYLNY